MLEFHSALTSCKTPGRCGAAGESGITLIERPLGGVLQVAGWPGQFEQAAARLMQAIGLASAGDYRMAQASERVTAFRIGPDRSLVIFDDHQECERTMGAYPGDLSVLDLSHARTRIGIGGKDAANLLARVISIDLHESVFKEGHFAQTGLHSVPVLLHRLLDRENTTRYDLYVPYTWAGSVWRALTLNALPFGYEIMNG